MWTEKWDVSCITVRQSFKVGATRQALSNCCIRSRFKRMLSLLPQIDALIQATGNREIFLVTAGYEIKWSKEVNEQLKQLPNAIQMFI